MKRIIFLLIALNSLFGTSVLVARDKHINDTVSVTLDSAAVSSQDTLQKSKVKLPDEKIKVWQISEDLGQIKPTKIDTNFINFNQTITDEHMSIANAWVGNYGSPMESKIYFERECKSDFLFAKPYTPYLQMPEDILFFNTKTPYSSVAYYRAGPSYGREERLKTSFAINVTPKLSFGFNADYIYGRGMYIAQSTNDVAGNFWVGYQGKKYISHAIIGLNRFKNYESGGIKNDSIVRYPELQLTRIKAENMEVNIGSEKSAQSRLQNQYILYNQKFRTGKTSINPDDSTEVFTPIINFVHTIKYEHDRRDYKESDTTSYYVDEYESSVYLNDSLTHDKVGYQQLKNTLGVELTEEFNKKAKFGLMAYASHLLRRYSYINSSNNWQSDNMHKIAVGGILSKENGAHFNYNVNGEMNVWGAIGEFNVNGNISTNINTGKKNLLIGANASIKNVEPDYYLNHYTSNYFCWENDFKFTKKIHADGYFSIPQWNLSLKGGFENITDYIFFNNKALPEQYDKNIQVLSFTLRKDFKVWLLHLENELTYQESSHQDALPLPRLSAYHNLYLTTTIFKVLTFQIGGELHYHTAYKAQSYNPATGMFYNTDEEIGDYPIMNAYANVHLKRVRFFVMYYHFNFKFSNNNYFSMPSYPINPAMLKLGLSWNFYD